MFISARRLTTLALAAALPVFAFSGIAVADDVVRAELGNRPDGTMYIKLDHQPVHDGKVTFIVHNASKDMEHEFVLGKTDLHLSQLPMNADGTEVDEEKAFSESRELEELAPGETRKLVVHLKPAHYAAICNLPGHAAAGMEVEFNVVPSEKKPARTG